MASSLKDQLSDGTFSSNSDNKRTKSFSCQGLLSHSHVAIFPWRGCRRNGRRNRTMHTPKMCVTNSANKVGVIWKGPLEVNESNLLLIKGAVSKLDQVAQDLAQLSSENLQGQSFHNLSERLLALNHSHCTFFLCPIKKNTLSYCNKWQLPPVLLLCTSHYDLVMRPGPQAQPSSSPQPLLLYAPVPWTIHWISNGFPSQSKIKQLQRSGSSRSNKSLLICSDHFSGSYTDRT